jgi:hypothetical protein
MFLSRMTPAKRKHLAGLLRVLAYASGVGVVCGALSIRTARAEMGDQALVVGRQIAALTQPTSVDVTSLSMNGQSIFVGNFLSDDHVTNILDRFEAHCRSNAAQTPESWRELSKRVKDEREIQNKPLFKAGILRSGAGDLEGTVMCFERGDESKPTMLEALKTFGETGDIGAFGQLRYAYVKRTTKGKTHVLTAWTTGHFNVHDMVPKDGADVPGSDFGEVPRPENAQRVFSARLEGTPFGNNVYTTDAAPKDVAASYDKKLTSQGWTAIDTELDRFPEMKGKGVVGHVYEKDGVVMTLAAHPQGAKTFASVGLAGVQASDDPRGEGRQGAPTAATR